MLENIGKISGATIELKGITVLAGENGTGKSTVGKALYGLLSTFHKVDEKIEKQKKYSIYHELEKMLNGLGVKGPIASLNHEVFTLTWNAITEIIQVLQKEYDSIDRIIESICEVIASNLVYKVKKGLLDNTESVDVIRSCAKSITALSNITDEQIYPVIANRSVGGIFQSQINHINDTSRKAVIRLEGLSKPIEVGFINNESSHIHYLPQDAPEPVYIDSTFAIEENKGSKSSDTYTSSLSYKLYDVNKALSSELDEVLYNRKIATTLKIANKTANGNILLDDDKILSFQDDKLIRPLKMVNLSLGVKSFAIIKRLLKNRQITETTALIIDEPETHLHPEWQIVFAELLVSLQKDIGLSILLATHSPYFFNSIEVFSEKYSIADKCKYYLAENDKSGLYASITDVTSNTEVVYQKLGAPLRTLRKMRYGEDDE
jgi:predicted ATP-dependent endonuclease of OLD family